MRPLYTEYSVNIRTHSIVCGKPIPFNGIMVILQYSFDSNSMQKEYPLWINFIGQQSLYLVKNQNDVDVKYNAMTWTFFYGTVKTELRELH